MVTLVLSATLGAAMAGLGLLLSPVGLAPRPAKVLRVALFGGVPGVLLGLLLVEDLWLDAHVVSLITSLAGSTLAVLTTAFGEL